MLNELQELRQSLAANGVQTEAWHPSIKPLAKYKTLLVELGQAGDPVAVSLMSRDRAAVLRNIQPDNQKSFPAFNLNSPLFKSIAGEDLGQAHLRQLADKLAHAPLAYRKKDFDRLQRLLSDFPCREIVPALAPAKDEPKLDSTRELLSLLGVRQGTPEDFLRQLGTVLLQEAMRGGLSADLVLNVLFGKASRNGSREPWQCLLFLELHDLSSFEYCVADPAVAAAWSHAMLSPQSEMDGRTIECALTGATHQTIGDKMPNPNLPVLGGTYLLSMNADVPCQTRYGRSATDIFPVTRQTVQAINDALLHMTHVDRKGKTWGPVPNGMSENPDLLIAFLEQSPEADLPVMPVVGFAEEEWPVVEDGGPQVDAMAPFAARTTKLIEALNLHRQAKGTHDDHLRLFVLSTIDKGRKQVLFDARYSTERIIAAKERWLDGSANTPEIDTRLLQGKGKKPLTTRRHTPSPAAVVSSFKQQWIRSGARSQPVSGVSLGRIYALLLDTDPRREAGWLLERYLPLKVTLLIAAGVPKRDEKRDAVYTYTGASLEDGARKDVLIVVATLGILLQVLGRNKEAYMKERDYQLGQFLQFADRLHLFYCEGARNGEVPPQLLGNAHISMAMQSPRRAMDVLAQRMPVYLAYAKQAAYGKQNERISSNAGIARWLERRLGEISLALKEDGFEEGCQDIGKAELLLGYLAVAHKAEASADKPVQTLSVDEVNHEKEQA